MAIIFHFTLAAIVVLFITYWIGLTVLQLLKFLLPLALMTLFSGHQTLRALVGAKTKAKIE
jgi:hypothetical protein